MPASALAFQASTTRSTRGHARRCLARGLVLLALGSAPAVAGVSTVSAPRIVYTPVNQTIDFTGSDAISGDSRVISMSASISGSCNPTAGNNYSVSLCGRVQLSLNDALGGTLFLDGTTKVQSSPNIWRTASGAIIDGDNPTDPALRGAAVLSINMNGTLAQLNGALGALRYIPALDYEDRTYNEETPPGAGTPTLNVLVNDGSASPTNASKTIVLRVEGPNEAPTLVGPFTALAATAGVDNLYPPGDFDPALFSVIDPELCLRSPNNRCNGAYSLAPAPNLPEPNDAMLLVVWLPQANCGKFSLRGTVGFANLGGAGFPTVNAILTAANGLDLEQDAATAILATLGSAGAVDLSAQTAGLTTVFAGTASDIADVRYALSKLTYNAPIGIGNTTCNLNIAFSDLGNNGMPQDWIAANPQANPAIPEHEIPNAYANTISATIQVTDPNHVFASSFE